MQKRLKVEALLLLPIAMFTKIILGGIGKNEASNKESSQELSDRKFYVPK